MVDWLRLKRKDNGSDGRREERLKEGGTRRRKRRREKERQRQTDRQRERENLTL